MTEHILPATGGVTATTIATYDTIAGDYAARWSALDVLASARARFAAWLPAGARVLDVGCGPGRDTAGLAALGLQVSGLDRSPGMLQQARAWLALAGG